MADIPTPFPPVASKPTGRPLLHSNVRDLEALRAAARRWYELRPRYAKRLRGAEARAAWAAFEAAVLALDPEARFDFGDIPGDRWPGDKVGG